jgi:hypothetical protein
LEESSINQRAYSLIRKIIVSQPPHKSQEPTGSFAHLQSEDWSAYQGRGPSFQRSVSEDFTLTKLSMLIDGNEYGFSEIDYREFNSIITEIQQDPIFVRQLSTQFIEENTMQWIVDIHIHGKSKIDLLNFIKTEADQAIENVTYYFPVINLMIPRPFKVGEVELTFFTKEYYDQQWERKKKNPEITEEIFDELYRKYQGRVFASFTVSAETKRGYEVAFQECCLAIDSFRCFTPTLFFPNNECYTDLAERINVNFQTDSISIPVNDKSEIRISKSAKNRPYILQKEDLEQMMKMGLETFSEKIKSRDENELSGLIVQAISFFSYSISTYDLHLRVIQLITILESLFLEEEQRNKMEETVKKRTKVLLNLKKSKDITDFDGLLAEMYQIRHKMVHKAKRLPIDIKRLGKFQFTVIRIVEHLCKLNKTIHDKATLITALQTL